MTAKKDPADLQSPGRKPFAPTEKDRATVKAMVGFGIPQADIAKVIGCHDETLRIHFRNEIATAAIEANAAIAQSLFQQATKHGNMTAAIWWTKCRMGWKETIRIGGEDGKPIPMTFRWDDGKLPAPIIEPAAADDVEP